jgi:SAM-dependent methyltransferase
MNDSPYYKDTGKVALASQLSMHVRRKMFTKFMTAIKPHENQIILDIGVTSDTKYQESNYFEKLYPYKDKIVCVGTEDGTHLETQYPGIRFVQIVPQEPLPFRDKEFDIAFCNAVIEHVGNSRQQREFVDEMLRVSSSFFLTTPNRWYPVEFHTAIPLLHFLPKKIYRRILSVLGETYWSKEDNLNLLSKKELCALFPKEANVFIDNIRLLGLSTNLVAYGKL